MSADFLANLALRAMEHDLRAVDGVRPRLASLFEASLAVSGRQDDRLAMAEVEPERVAAEPGAERPFTATVHREALPTAPAQPATASENLDLRLAAVVDAVRGPQRNSSVLAPKARASDYFDSVASPPAEQIEGEAGDFSIRPQVVRIAGVSGSSLGTPVLSLAQSQAQSQWDSASTGEEWRPPALAAQPPGARLPVAPLADEPIRGAATVAPEQVIQVTIGRIEVRATHASPAARKTSLSAQPATLDEYQKQRSQRGGGR